MNDFQQNKSTQHHHNNNYTFTAPLAGNYTFECWGANGGGITALPGGIGGYCKGDLTVSKNEILYVYVGGVGYTNVTREDGCNAGGWNGGGISSINTHGGPGAGGGGATDIRLVVASTTNPAVWNSEASLRSRIMVAGGGGGTGLKPEHNTVGGCGGGLIGGTGTNTSNAEWRQSTWVSLGGTQTSATRNTGNQPENVWHAQGGFGYASQTRNTMDWWGGGGGGGWYGGQKGGGTGGGGGSSFISGHIGCNPVNTSTGAHIGAYTGSNNAFTTYNGKTYRFTNTQMLDGDGIEWTLATQKRVYVDGDRAGVVTPAGVKRAIPSKINANGYARIALNRW